MQKHWVDKIPFLVRQFFFLFIAILFIEIILRGLVSGPDPNQVFDTELGSRNVAGSKMFAGTEGRGTTYFGEFGEVVSPSLDGENVIVLGDSYTEARQVDTDQKFVSIAETQLLNDGFRINLRNFGSSGASLADYAYTAPLYLSKYHPKLIVIQTSFGDFTDSMDVKRNNHFEISQNGQGFLVHFPPVFFYGKFADIKRSLDLSIIDSGYARYVTIRKKIPAFSIKTAFQQRSSEKPNISDTADYRLSPFQQIDLVKASFQSLPMVIVLLPNTPTIDGNQIQFTNSPEYDQLVGVLRKNGYMVVDPSEEMNKLPAQGIFPRGFSNTSPGRGHLNVYGHQIVGDLLAKTIEGVLK